MNRRQPLELQIPADDDATMDSAHPTPPVASSVKKPLELAEVVEETAIMQDGYESSLRINEVNRLLLESAGDGIYATDAGGRTTFINSARTKMTGWAAEDVLGKPERVFVNHVRPGSRTDSPDPLQDSRQLVAGQGKKIGFSGVNTAPAFPPPAPARWSCAKASSWEGSSSFATSPKTGARKSGNRARTRYSPPSSPTILSLDHAVDGRRLRRPLSP